ncbi:hypothetical protein HN51_006740 [Arachis hypogaea]|uniref:Protein RALF-like 34 n=1 Tax=Arachis duranensis TaxID=130453 RepID=A0A6P4DAN2_ARADU|nr:protein RALF-like 34 [Arachis duranensis]XP_025698691.1 protein RALF-like 34 [Arachis hypogaea]XP_057762264.1 protein RALF-like 34 [Arachis stenosperma]QHO40728.1 Protein RALF-like [Arachis hypogaea]
MAAVSLPLLRIVVLAVCSFLLLCLALSPNALAVAQIEETSLNLMSDALEWPTATMSSLYDADVEEEIEDEEVEGGRGNGRRSLFWRRMKYYISYGALSANRIPCPPRSGRSYYTHNCFKARGPAHPYTRGCSIITRCRR